MSAHLSDELLAAHLDGTSNAAEREAADAHLAACAQCRDEVELAAGAREALRALPTELRPPVDIAGAVVGEATSGSTGAGGAPRWYRAVGIAAVAAAIGLAAVVVPSLGGRDAQESAGSPASASAGLQPAAGGAAPDEQDTGAGVSESTSRSDRVALVSGGEVDDAELRRLLGRPRDSLSYSEAAHASLIDAIVDDDVGEAIACLRTAGAPSDARPVRLLDVTYRGTPSFVGVFVGVPDDVGTLVYVASKDGCRLLASGSSATGSVTPVE